MTTHCNKLACLNASRSFLRINKVALVLWWFIIKFLSCFNSPASNCVTSGDMKTRDVASLPVEGTKRGSGCSPSGGDQNDRKTT